MEGKHTQSQAQVPGQKQNRKAKGDPKVQNEPGKALQKYKMDYGENRKQASSRSPKPIDSEFNGILQKAGPDLKSNPEVKASTPEKAKIRTKNENNYEDKKQKPLEDKPPTEQVPAVTPNDSFSNENKDKGPDKNGSEADSGYTTPKKRKSKLHIAKAEENFNVMRCKMIPPAPRVSILQQGLENLKHHPSDQKSIRIESPKAVWKSETWEVGAGHGRAGPEYTQEKAFNTNPDPNNPKVDTWPRTVPTAPVVPKEEAWSLFKQPTVFSMSNSNIPKVTYASKVKQNLYRVQSPPLALGSPPQSELSPESVATLSSSSAIIGCPILMSSHRLTQVPMSPLKSVDSLDFANGPEKSMNAKSSQTLSLEARLIRRPSSKPKSVNHKTNLSYPPVEPSLFPHAAPMGLMPNVKPPQTEVQMLREIFQNDWGLSFIAEPSIGPEIAQEMTPDPKVIQPPQPHKYPSRLAPQDVPEHVLLPKVYDMNKWLNPQSFEDIIKATVPVKESKALMLNPSLGDDHLQQANAKSPDIFTLLPNNHKIENPEPLPGSPSPNSTLENSEQKNAWEPSNVRAAVQYHMTEMKSILDRQKQDSCKIIIYDESMDSSTP